LRYRAQVRRGGKLPNRIFDPRLRPPPKAIDMISGVTSSQSPSSSNQIQNKGLNLQAQDFIKMMITQLQNQDPLEPAKNQDLLAQMSQIGQLQSTTQLQDSLKGLVLQNNIGSAGNLIGKTVQGLDDQNKPVAGLVNSVRVQQDQVYLELDNGNSLAMTRVTSIAPAPAAGH
jgi:flagellar basal-body rod modification protein FlgD